jgi:hypothetical protein
MVTIRFIALALGLLLQGTAVGQDELVLGQKPLKDFSKLKSGDILFIRSNSGPRADSIAAITKAPLTHCGIVIKEGQSTIVYEGAGKPGDYKDVAKWQKYESTEKGKAPPVPLHAIYVRRYTGSLEGKLADLARRAKELHDTPYDKAFAWNNRHANSGKEYIYCSELIWKAFHDAVGVDLGAPHPLKDYLAGTQEEKERALAAFKEYLGPNYNLEEKVISPVDVFMSDKLVAVTDDAPGGASPSPNATVSAKATTPRSAGFTLSDPVQHAGEADGSAGVPVGEDRFIGATDENNFLRLYPSDKPDAGAELYDLAPVLGFEKEEGEYKECDLEGAARMGDLIFWIGSHGLNKNGKVKPSRRVLFATASDGLGAGVKLKLKGTPCKSLMDSFRAIPELKSAAEIKPEDKGGFNIESLCAKDNSLLIGFRNPVSEQGALVIPLLNPLEIINGKPPVLGEAFRLPLDGRGIRDMTRWQGQFLIVAGDYQDKTAPGAKAPKLFRWSGNPKEAPVPMEGELGDLNPEAALAYGPEGREKLQLLSDDGGDSFRSVWVSTTNAP